MKSTMYNAATILLLAAIACAAPTSVSRDTSSVTIDIKTGDGDSATTLSVNLDQVTATSGLTSQAVAASISTPGVFCQAFADAVATNTIGNVFSLGSDASFSSTSNGDTASQASDAVTIAAYLCSNSQAGVAPKTSSSTGTNNQGSGSTGGSSSSSGSVHVQFEQSADQFVQTDIPLDNSLFPTKGSFLGDMGLDLSLVSASGADLSKVSCQAFQDAAGTVKVGNPATATGDAILSANPNLPSHIEAIKCGVTA